MKFCPVQTGDTRTCSGFLLFPLTAINKQGEPETRWLENARWQETAGDVDIADRCSVSPWAVPGKKPVWLD